MKYLRAVLAAIIGGLLAAVYFLARRSSKETGKSLPASLTDVPGEAQRLASDVRSRATDAAGTSWEAIKEKEAAVKDRVIRPLRGEGGEESGDVAEE